MLELYVTDTDASTGSIPVSWCVDKSLLERLANEGITDPQLVLIVSPENYREYMEIRKVVPLKDLVAYLELPVVGKVNIWGFVSEVKEKKLTKERYLSRKYAEHSSSLLTQDGEFWSAWMLEEFKDHLLDLSGPISVIVPEECFAKEPPQWEKDWVNKFFNYLPKDQCDYRRRRVFAYSVQPLIMLGNWLLRLLIFLVALLVGAKNTSLKPLLHLLTYSLTDTSDMISGGSIFIRSLPEPLDGRKNFKSDFVWRLRSLCLLPLMPMVWVPLIIFAKLHVLSWVLIIFGILFGILIHMLVEFIFTGETKKLYEKLFGPKSLWYLEEKEMGLLVCDGKNKSKKLSDLPCHRRSIKLQYQELKSRVCKPFSRWN